MRMILSLAVLLSLILVGVTACSSKDKVPSGVIPPEKMSHILWDMVQADQYSDAYLNQDTLRARVKTGTIRLYKEVFQMHQVSLEDFKKSMTFYLDHPDITRGLFDSVIEIGKRQQTAQYKNQPTPSGGSYGKGNIPGRGAVIPSLIPGRPQATPGRGAGIPGRLAPLLHPSDSARRRAADSAHRHRAADSIRRRAADNARRHHPDSTRHRIKMG